MRDTALFDLWQAGRYTPHSVEDAGSVCARLLPMFEEAGIALDREMTSDEIVANYVRAASGSNAD